MATDPATVLLDNSEQSLTKQFNLQPGNNRLVVDSLSSLNLDTQSLIFVEGKSLETVPNQTVQTLPNSLLDT